MHAADLFAYERLMARSLQTNAMQWQAPSLALAAQAFLLTVALRDGSTEWQTTAVSLVGLLITAMAWQLMGRHRYYFHLDQAAMKRLEAKLSGLQSKAEFSLPPMADRSVQAANHKDVVAPFTARLSSFTVWRAGFVCIAFIDVVIMASEWWRFLPLLLKIVFITAAFVILAGGGLWSGRRRKLRIASASHAPPAA